MQVLFPHEVVFTNKDRISVSDVAHSLIANEQIILSVGAILEGCFDGLTVEKINVRFIYATTSSPLKEYLATGILFTFQDTLKREVPDMMERITGEHFDEKYTTLVTVIFLVVVVYGIEEAWDMFKNSKKEGEKQSAPSQIIMNYGNLVNAGGDMMGVSPARLSAAMKSAFPQKRIPFLAKTALGFIRPAKQEKGAMITGAGLAITPEAIEASPSDLDIAMDDDDNDLQTPLQNVEVVIHATDIDHHSSGWAGHITGVWEKRLRMKLFPSIAPYELFGKETIKADVIVMAKRQWDGNHTPYLFHVLRVY